MPDFLDLPVGDLRKLLNDPRMGDAQKERIEQRIALLEKSAATPPVALALGGSSKTTTLSTGKRRGKQNQTETRAFRDLIAPRLATGEIVRAEFEAITFHVHGFAKYTPDHVCWMPPECPYDLWLIEVKGAHVREKDKLRFLGHAKARPWLRWTMVQWSRAEKRWIVRYDKKPEVES